MGNVFVPFLSFVIDFFCYRFLFSFFVRSTSLFHYNALEREIVNTLLLLSIQSIDQIVKLGQLLISILTSCCERLTEIIKQHRVLLVSDIE